MKFGKFSVALATALLLTTSAFAEDGWEKGSPYNKKFDESTVQTITGKVIKVDRDLHPLTEMAPGFAAVIRTKKGEEIQVQVGPIWFTSFYKQKWDIKPGDTVTITGSRVKIDNKDVIMASHGEKGKLKMTVRGKHGVPIWDLGPTDF
jgi:hypothetical protein